MSDDALDRAAAPSWLRWPPNCCETCTGWRRTGEHVGTCEQPNSLEFGARTDLRFRCPRLPAKRLTARPTEFLVFDICKTQAHDARAGNGDTKMRIIKTSLIVAAWLAASVANAGFVNGYFRTKFHDLDQSALDARSDIAFSIGWSLFPPSWIMTPFVTAFYYGGWTLEYRPFPCTSSNPDIWCDGVAPESRS